MKTLLDRILVIAVVLICVVLPVGAFIYYLVSNPSHDCAVGDDACIDRVLPELRDIRERDRSRNNEQITTWTKVRDETEQRHNDKINALKGKRSTASSAELLKQGKRDDVSPELLTWKSMFVPQALADTTPSTASGSMNEHSVVVRNDKGGIRFADVIPVGRYGKVLAEAGSPYASVAIEQYCNKAGLTQDLCDLLVGITYAESNAGTNFRCNWKTREEAVALGQNYYHNPAGYKDFRDDGKQKNPDENGCYLRQFDSWDAFWEFYTAKMKEGYFDKGAVTPASISRWYVGGNGTVKYSWVYRVQYFMTLIQQSNS